MMDMTKELNAENAENAEKKPKFKKLSGLSVSPLGDALRRSPKDCELGGKKM